jgi:hypothetical protein
MVPVAAPEVWLLGANVLVSTVGGVPDVVPVEVGGGAGLTGDTTAGWPVGTGEVKTGGLTALLVTVGPDAVPEVVLLLLCIETAAATPPAKASARAPTKVVSS